jgi:hypothetical protein
MRYRLGRAAAASFPRSAAFAGMLAVLASCASAHISQPSLSMSDVAGSWSNGAGSTIVFLKDHRFTAVAIDMQPNDPECSHVSGPGDWQFYEGESASGGPAYKSGNHVELSFDGQNDTCDIELISWQVNSTPGVVPRL